MKRLSLLCLFLRI